ncbi:site-2 protease family protein [Nocardioides sp.]|uniref:site-2 protease family protein n=1 Tax=Nocardioides sp. TaxID=35761 RepID=UPI003D0966DA
MSHADPDLEPVKREHPPGTIRIGQIAGIDVLVTSTWFLIAGLVAVALAPRVEQVQPGLGAGKYLAGLAFAVVLYLSVLAHEAAHALMARHYGHSVSSITLHFLGGVTAIEGESRRPREEFWIAVVGPLMSLAISFVAFLLTLLTPGGLIGMTVDGLFVANLVVGVLNLVPGLPLDGGRVLKSAVWAAAGNPHRGTIAAAWGGRIAAILALFLPLLYEPFFHIEPQLFDFLMAGIVALFLWTGASAALSSANLRRRLPSLVARNLARRTLAVPEDLPLAEAVRRAQEAEAGSIVTVTHDGQPTGIVNEAALRSTPEERRPWVATSSVARTMEPGLALPATIYGEELILAVSRRPAHEYLLLEDDGTIFGVLTTADVDRAFRESRH